MESEAGSAFYAVTFEKFVTVDSVRLRASNKFLDAVDLEDATVLVGQEVCGTVPEEVDESTWYRVDCQSKITAKTA